MPTPLPDEGKTTSDRSLADTPGPPEATPYLPGQPTITDKRQSPPDGTHAGAPASQQATVGWQPADLQLSPGAEPLPGYRLVRPLGKGGFGEVWEASAPGGFKVALKLVPLDRHTGGIELRALQIIKDVRHPNLLTIFGAWQTDALLLIGMELADRTLWDRFQEAVEQGLCGIPVRELLRYAHEAAKVLDYLNKPRHYLGGSKPVGIQHCDIKPQNILLLGDGVKVADFGLVQLLEQRFSSHQGGMTLLYAAPELFQGQISRWSDQYSLAVTYCHLRAGRPPFNGSAAEVQDGHLRQRPDLAPLSEKERAVVARALAKEPQQRWPNCRTFVRALAEGTRSEAVLENARAAEPSIAPSTELPPPRQASGPDRLPPIGQRTPPPAAAVPRAGSSRWLRLSMQAIVFAVLFAGTLLLIRNYLRQPAGSSSSSPGESAMGLPLAPPDEKFALLSKPAESAFKDDAPARSLPEMAPAPSVRPTPPSLVKQEMPSVKAEPSPPPRPVPPTQAPTKESPPPPPTTAPGPATRPVTVESTPPTAEPVATPSPARGLSTTGVWLVGLGAGLSALVVAILLARGIWRRKGVAPVDRDAPLAEAPAPWESSAPVEQPPPSEMPAGAQRSYPELPPLPVVPVSEGGPGELRCLEGHADSVWCVAFLPDGFTAVSGGADDSIRFWYLASGREADQLIGHSDGVTGVVVSADGRRVLSGSLDGTVRLWDLESSAELCRLTGHGDEVTSVALSPDSRRALSASRDGTVRLWDVESGQELRQLVGHSDWVQTVVFAPDGRLALSGGKDRTLRLWDVEEGREIRCFEGHDGWVNSVAFSPDGRLALSGSGGPFSASGDHTMRLWDIESGRELRRFVGHSDWVRSVAFARDGKRVLSGSDDETVRLWDVETGQEASRFEGHTWSVISVAFSPDGRKALSGSDDKTLRWWRLPE